MSTLPNPFLTEEQYLEIERKAEYRSEYFRGEMFAMAGGGARHNTLIGNLTVLLTGPLRNRGCRRYLTDMRLRVTPVGLYTYPDFMIVCGKPEFIGTDTLLNPSVVVEVLSPSTEAYDRGAKFEYYQALPSLQQYVLVAQDRMSVMVFSVKAGTYQTWSSPDDIVRLEPGVEFRLADLYEDVELDAPPAVAGA